MRISDWSSDVCSSDLARAAVYLRLLCDPDGGRGSYFREAIEDCSTDFDLGYLSIEGARCHTLTQELEAVHFGLDQTAAMIDSPLLPDRSEEHTSELQSLMSNSYAVVYLKNKHNNIIS